MNLLLKGVVVFLAIAYVAASTDSDDPICHHFPHCKSCPKNKDGKNSCIECRNHLYGLDLRKDPTPCLRCRKFARNDDDDDRDHDDDCHFCKNNTKCDVCKRKSFGPDLNGVASCSPCSENCADCGKSGGGKCDKCKEGYFVKNQLCSACLAKCRFCTDATSCSMCDRGFYKSNPTTCSACIDNCDLCYDSTRCDRCFEGYYMKTDTQCSSCPENCAKCDRNGKCSECKNGKISEDKLCKCCANCRSCTKIGWGKCDDCQFGYKLTEERQCERRGNN